MEAPMANEMQHESRRGVPNGPRGLRVGVPWRSSKDEKDEAEAKKEAAGNLPKKMEPYLRAIREAGGEPVPLSLGLPLAELQQLASTLHAFVLPGSPVDVDPKLYGAKPQPHCGDPDQQREQTDYALLDHAFAARKPVLAICYGAQLLNVKLGGTLLQDISSTVPTTFRHHRLRGEDDRRHPVGIEAGSRLAALADSGNPSGAMFQPKQAIEVNSSHHQAIERPGRGLRITARAPDGVIEAVEWTEGDNWIVGVQWHPERMKGHALSEALLRELVQAARGQVSGIR